nr:uncharacterized RING finger protein P8B7.15c-like [Tanacetum cinerariifolium]
MRNEGCATWDGVNSTWGGRARVIGTVLPDVVTTYLLRIGVVKAEITRILARQPVRLAAVTGLSSLMRLIKVMIVHFLAGQPVRPVFLVRLVCNHDNGDDVNCVGIKIKIHMDFWCSVDVLRVCVQIEYSKKNITKVKQLYGKDFDDFGEYVFEVPKVAPLILGNPTNPLSKTQALANIVALDHPQTTTGGVVRSLARQGYVFMQDMYERLKPPEGCVCHRCKIPGYHI